MNLEKINEVKRLYALAEHRLKIVETSVGLPVGNDVRSGLAVPTVNQLRYAGYHVLEYITDPQQEDQLHKAMAHCQRAIYDIYQIELLFYLKRFAVFQEDFKKLPISETVRDYFEWERKHADAQKVIQDTHESPEREKYYDVLSPHIATLSDIHKYLPIARDNLNKKLVISNRNATLAWFGIILGILGIAFAFK